MSSNRDIVTLPLNPTVLGKLLRAGLNTVYCFASIDPRSLSKCAGISQTEAQQVLQLLGQAPSTSSHESEKVFPKSALDLLQEEQARVPIVTFCEGIDSMLGGGVPCCQLTEFCGAPGTGKTQICMQLAVDVHIPESLGGVEGQAIFIDTEGSLVIERLADIAQSAVEHCHQVATDQGLTGWNAGEFTADNILAGIHCYRCHDYYELLALIQLLPEVLSQNEKVKLVLVDSLASPFRHDIEDMSMRTRLLVTAAQDFLRMAACFKVAVVFTNQMTTKIMPKEEDSHLIPALGDTWAHACANRIVLSSQAGPRGHAAFLYKSPDKQDSKCMFQITQGGVRDVS